MDSSTPVPPIPESQEPAYFSVSLLKLGILSVTTLGLYELYWMYQNWKLIKKRTGHNLSPFWRSFFGVLFVYPLLKDISSTFESHPTAGKNISLSAGLLAIFWILLTISYRLPDPFWLICILSFIPLLFVQTEVNRFNAMIASHHPLNSQFTWANWLWIILGSIFLILAIVGTFLSPA